VASLRRAARPSGIAGAIRASAASGASERRRRDGAATGALTLLGPRCLTTAIIDPKKRGHSTLSGGLGSPLDWRREHRVAVRTARSVRTSPPYTSDDRRRPR